MVCKGRERIVILPFPWYDNMSAHGRNEQDQPAGVFLSSMDRQWGSPNMAIHFKTFPGCEAISKQLWNELASNASPMMEWEYFHALETSGAVSPERGYRACHLVAFAGEEPFAIIPLYERDRAWVEFGDGGLIEFLSELTGIPYRAGLVGAIPFTPVPGYRVLCRPGFDNPETTRLLLNHIDTLCTDRGLWSCRLYFVSPHFSDLHSLLLEHGYVALRTTYRLWHNHDYRTFDDYLLSFKSSRRTKIKREIRAIRDRGIRLEMVRGEDAPAYYYKEICELYERTWTKHMGVGMRPFLNRLFFEELQSSFRHRSSFAVASMADRRLAMALFYEKADVLYGRYWGCYEEVPFLHFAACYYHPIDYAIRKGIRTMDPGFGGEHKPIRGYEMEPVYHYIKFHGEQESRIARSILQRLRDYSHYRT